MHYLNILLDNLLLKDYRTKYSLRLSTIYFRISLY